MDEPAETHRRIGPGDRLRSARERRGLSVRDAAASLRLDPAVITALEADDYAALPAPIFVKGYLNAYTRLLGLPADECIAEYTAASNGAAPPPLVIRRGTGDDIDGWNVDRQGIVSLLDSGALALVSPLGYSATGEIFNLNFADVAIQIALAINADKLIAFNDDGPIRDASGNLYRELTLLKCEKFLVEQPEANRSNTYFSLRACYKACDGGVPRAHVISAREDGALLKELFTRDGAGTMVHRDSYETIRRARIDDVQGILKLIEPLESDGILVKRSRELLEREIHCFIVMEKDSTIIGCAALYPFSDGESGELACMAVQKEYRGNGRAAKLLTHIERQALKLDITRLYVLTTQTAHWFLEQGFVETLVDLLPVERKALYNFQRKSKVFVKTLRGIR